MPFLYQDIEAKRERDAIEFEEHGPRCATCKHGLVFNACEFPYALSRDVAVCRVDEELMEDPYEPNEEFKECWEPK